MNNRVPDSRRWYAAIGFWPFRAHYRRIDNREQWMSATESVVGSSAERRASASLPPLALSIRGMSGRSASPSDAVLVRRLQRICRDSGRSHPGARRNRYGRPNFSWSARCCRTFHRLSGECRIEGVPRLIDKSLPGRSDAAPGDPLGRRSDHRRGADCSPLPRDGDRSGIWRSQLYGPRAWSRTSGPRCSTPRPAG